MYLELGENWTFWQIASLPSVSVLRHWPLDVFHIRLAKSGGGQRSDARARERACGRKAYMSPSSEHETRSEPSRLKWTEVT